VAQPILARSWYEQTHTKLYRFPTATIHLLFSGALHPLVHAHIVPQLYRPPYLSPKHCFVACLIFCVARSLCRLLQVATIDRSNFSVEATVTANAVSLKVGYPRKGCQSRFPRVFFIARSTGIIYYLLSIICDSIYASIVQ